MSDMPGMPAMPDESGTSGESGMHRKPVWLRLLGKSVRYEWSQNAPVEVDYTELSDVFVVVLKNAFFADSNGFMMVCDLSEVYSDSPYFVATNASYHDFMAFGVNVPKEVQRAQLSTATALTELYGIDLDGTKAAVRSHLFG